MEVEVVRVERGGEGREELDVKGWGGMDIWG